MNVRNVCLAILHDGETTGYQIRKLSTDGEFAYFVDASYGSIYPALARLENDKLVTSRVEQQEGRPAKKVYSITELGRETFHQSLFDKLDADVHRSAFLLFARFAPQLPASLVEQRLNEQLDKINEELAQVTSACEEKLSPSDRWVVNYGMGCLTESRDLLQNSMADLIALAKPDQKDAQAAQ